MKIKVFYHVAELPGWNDMMTDQLSLLYESGLLEAAESVYMCVNGKLSNFDPAKAVTNNFKNIIWKSVHGSARLGEYPTLNFIKEHCDSSSEEFYVCYIHMKGLSRPNDINSKDWRRYLEYWTVERWKSNVKFLDDGNDAVGTNWFDKHETIVDPTGKTVRVFPHFSANFWWTRASYIRRLETLPNPDNVVVGETSRFQQQPYSKENIRYDNEAWIGSGNPKVHCIDESPGKTQYPGWHFDNPYPREKYAPLPKNKITAGAEYKAAEFHNLHMPRILVDRRKALGDVLMITPVLRELRERYGKMSFIQVVTEETHALYNNPHVNAVVKPENMKKEDPWDVYINLNDAYESNPLCNYVDSYMYRAFGVNCEQHKKIDRSLVIVPTNEEILKIDSILQNEIKSDYIVVHMRRWAWENKNIDPNTWGTFFTLLNHQHPDIKIVSVGAQYDYVVTDLMNGVNMVGKLSVGEIAMLIARSKCFVGGDSGPYHIASATTTPIVALLSHMDPDQILPTRDRVYGKDVTVVQSDVPCLGCYKRQKAPVRNLDCENDEQWLCAKKFDPNAIMQAVGKYL